MADYRISFFKNLVSSNGHRFKCLQGEAVVRGSGGAAEAIETASRQFEREHGLRDWRFHADMVEVESVDDTEEQDAPAAKYAAA